MSLIEIILKQRFERAEPEDVVHQFAGQRVLFARVELNAAIGGDLRKQTLDVDGQPFGWHRRHRRWFKPRQTHIAQFYDCVR